jgi:hypothetical protein
LFSCSSDCQTREVSRHRVLLALAGRHLLSTTVLDAWAVTGAVVTQALGIPATTRIQLVVDGATAAPPSVVISQGSVLKVARVPLTEVSLIITPSASAM